MHHILWFFKWSIQNVFNKYSLRCMIVLKHLLYHESREVSFQANSVKEVWWERLKRRTIGMLLCCRQGTIKFFKFEIDFKLRTGKSNHDIPLSVALLKNLRNYFSHLVTIYGWGGVRVPVCVCMSMRARKHSLRCVCL